MIDRLFWNKLEDRLTSKIAEFGGVAGLSLVDFNGKRRIDINASEPFPTASSIKIHLLIALHQLAFESKLDLDARVEIVPELFVPGSGVLAYLDDSLNLSWRDIANLMIIVSDNTATNMVIELLGYERMANFFESWGLQNTILRRKMQEHKAVARNEENLSTPKEMAQIMEMLLAGDAFGEGVAQECFRILKKPIKSPITSALPVDATIANKPGGMDNVRCDVAAVFVPRRPYVLSIMTKFGGMDRTEQDNWISDTARIIHPNMLLLSTTSGYGQGVPPSYREG